MRVYINGEARDFSSPLSLDQLITELDLPPSRIAVELNHAVVRRNEWNTTELRDDDRIEIVHFVGGGQG